MGNKGSTNATKMDVSATRAASNNDHAAKVDVSTTGGALDNPTRKMVLIEGDVTITGNVTMVLTMTEDATGNVKTITSVTENDRKAPGDDAAGPRLTIVPREGPKKWIGLQVDTTAKFDREAWLVNSAIQEENVVDKPNSSHLTLLFGVTPDGWASARAIIESTALLASDIVFEATPRLVEPVHTPDRSFWCLHVVAESSPKLVTLLTTLRSQVPTPGERANHLVLPHVTCLVVKRA